MFSHWLTNKSGRSGPSATNLRGHCLFAHFQICPLTMLTSSALVSCLLVSSTIASSLRHLSTAERKQLSSELDAWKASKAGKTALKHGFMPHQGREEDAVMGDSELERFAATKQAVAALNEAHPAATFSTNNPFALMTDDEFATFVHGGLEPTDDDRLTRRITEQAPLTPSQREATGVDWAAHRCMSPVHDQGFCGSCWSFASVGAVEFGHCLGAGQLIDFSEQQLVSCAAEAGKGCKGGWPNKALNYIAATGLCTEPRFTTRRA